MTLQIASFSQVELRGKEDIGVPNFYIDALTFYSLTSSLGRLDLYAQIYYNDLYFVKNENVFFANFEITIGIYNTSEELVKEKIWNETIQANSYNETISPNHYKLNHQSFLLVPNRYNIIVQIRDNHTKKQKQISRSVEIRDYTNQKFFASDLMILNKLDLTLDCCISLSRHSFNK